MKLPLRYYGHPDLRTKASPVKEITPEIIQLAQDMIETMDAHNGVGLAGPQVGRLLRIFVRRSEELLPDGNYVLGDPEVIINPAITQPSEEQVEMSEGCLSIPGFHAKVLRPKKIHLKYQNLKGEWVEEELDGLLARVTMHENDHLNGVLYIDRLAEKERKKLEPVLREIKVKFAKNLS